MSKRIKWLDFAKGFTILAVVMDHSALVSNELPFELLRYILLIIAMPLFFAISGYLYKPTKNIYDFKILLYKKVTSFIIPYVIFTLITIATDVFGNIANHNYSFNYIHFLFVPIGYMWFLYVLFFIFIIVGIMDLVHVNLYLQIGVSIILMFSQIYLPWQIDSSGNINPLAGIGSYLIFFYIGYLIKRPIITNMLKYKGVYLFVLWILLMICQTCIGNLSSNTDLITYNDIIVKLLSVPALFTLFMQLHNNGAIFKYFNKYGKYTLVIYLCQSPALALITFILKRILINYYLIFIISLFIAWMVSIVIVKLSLRSKFINFIFYPRKYINKLFY